MQQPVYNPLQFESLAEAEMLLRAAGFLIPALHDAGLASLTHTPSPMGFLNEILGRPSNERPYLQLVTGYPAGGTIVPVISKKELEEVVSFI